MEYIYDANGNMVSSSSPSKPDAWMQFTWDEENRLMKTQNVSGIVDYKYDDAGKRIIKKSDTGETVYVNDNYTVRNGDVSVKIFFLIVVFPKLSSNKLSHF